MLLAEQEDIAFEDDGIAAVVHPFADGIQVRRHQVNGLGLMGNRDEVDDAVQEVFIDLWRKAARYDPKLSGEVTFVTMIARRKLTLCCSGH